MYLYLKTMRMKSYTWIPFAALLMLSGCNGCQEEETLESLPEKETPTLVPDDTLSLPENTPVEVQPMEESGTSVEAEVVEAPVGSTNAGTATFIKAHGEDPPADFKPDLATFAADEVAIHRDGDCPENCGKKVFLINQNKEQTIVVAVQVSYKKDGERTKERKLYRVAPEARLELGCSSDCTDETNSVKWKIISAQYAA